MGYHTALNSDFDFCRKNGSLVHEFVFKCKKIKVYELNYRWYLYIGEYQMSEIINGKQGFEKQYKGDFFKWADKIYKKDMDKVNKLKKMAEEVVKDAEKIESIWK